MQQKAQKTVERERGRLLNAAHRFAKIAQDNPVKLFGLLYMLDIRFFREAGRSCTGEIYYAMADGPAPGSLRPLLVMRDWGLNTAIGLLTATDANGPWHFDPRQYGHRELTIMHELEATYAKATSRDLNLDDANAWWRVYTRRRGIGAVIPYEITLPCADGGFPLDKPVERKGFTSTMQLRQAMLAQPNPR